MIDQGVNAALAARDANRTGDDNHTSRTGGRRTEHVTRECTYQDFMKCQPLYFKGTEGVVEPTQWFERMEMVFRISNCLAENQIELKKKMANKYCSRNEMKKIKTELRNLEVQGTDLTRPNIMFSVCLCARFQENPKNTHVEVVKRIFRYIRGTSHLGLWYLKGIRIKTVVYADLDHTDDYVDRKSTSGVFTFMACCLTSWFAKKQTALSISTMKAEYVSAGKACQQALWMKQALIDYGIRLNNVPITCDNKGAINLSKNPV
uniref:Copia protein n=1 Tax=Tanacetum cinerariifolium TaxID=118510 RepID=A0A6L2JY51_TANCI|nr:copia protein [Tanacetum cinerariifolium]